MVTVAVWKNTTHLIPGYRKPSAEMKQAIKRCPAPKLPNDLINVLRQPVGAATHGLKFSAGPGYAAK
jgi:hypothetical protein